jgi:hypothetical protein
MISGDTRRGAVPLSRTQEWVILTYRMPREPSTPRIALWRTLRRLGAVQLQDGVVALPADARTREQLEWAAHEVDQAGGDSSLWIARPSSRGQERSLARAMAASIAQEYRGVRDAAVRALDESESARRRTMRRLRNELRRIRLRDFFPPPERAEALEAVDRLAHVHEGVP